MSNPPVILPPASRTAAKPKPKEKTAGHAAPREHHQRFQQLMEQKAAVRNMSAAGALGSANPAHSREVERRRRETSDAAAHSQASDGALASLLQSDTPAAGDARVSEEVRAPGPDDSGRQMHTPAIAFSIRSSSMQDGALEPHMPSGHPAPQTSGAGRAHGGAESAATAQRLRQPAVSIEDVLARLRPAIESETASTAAAIPVGARRSVFGQPRIHREAAPQLAAPEATRPAPAHDSRMYPGGEREIISPDTLAPAPSPEFEPKPVGTAEAPQVAALVSAHKPAALDEAPQPRIAIGRQNDPAPAYAPNSALPEGRQGNRAHGFSNGSLTQEVSPEAEIEPAPVGRVQATTSAMPRRQVRQHDTARATPLQEAGSEVARLAQMSASTGPQATGYWNGEAPAVLRNRDVVPAKERSPQKAPDIGSQRLAAKDRPATVLLPLDTDPTAVLANSSSDVNSRRRGESLEDRLDVPARREFAESTITAQQPRPEAPAPAATRGRQATAGSAPGLPPASNEFAPPSPQSVAAAPVPVRQTATNSGAADWDRPDEKMPSLELDLSKAPVQDISAAPPDASRRLAAEPEGVAQAKSPIRRDVGTAGTDVPPDRDYPVQPDASDRNSSKNGTPEKTGRASGGAAEPWPLPPQQASAAASPVAAQVSAPQNPPSEAAAQQILRHISQAAPVLQTPPSAMHVQAPARGMRLKLAPENLGEVEIRITREAGGLAIRIRAERRETAEMLLNDSSVLRERLEFIAAADARIEIEFDNAADSGQHLDMPHGGGANFHDEANRQAGQPGGASRGASASRKSSGASQDDEAQDPGQRPRHGRRDVLLL